MEPHRPSVRGDHPILAPIGVARGRMLGIGPKCGGVGGVYDLRPESGLGPPREGVAEERLDLRADVQQRRVGRERVLRWRLLVGDHGRVLDDLPEALLRHADALGRLHALADVQDDALPVRGRVVRAADEDGLLVDPDGVAVRGNHPIVHRKTGCRLRWTEHRRPARRRRHRDGSRRASARGSRARTRPDTRACRRRAR